MDSGFPSSSRNDPSVPLAPATEPATAPATDVAPTRWVDVALAALYRRVEGGRVELLVARRHAEAVRGGLWEFPGGKIEPGEPASVAAVREIEEEVGIGRDAFVDDPRPLLVVEHSDPEVVREKSVRLHAFIAEVKPSAMPQALGASEVRWVGVEQLADFEWPKANAPINAALAELLRGEAAPR